MRSLKTPLSVALLLCRVRIARSVNLQEKLLITSPPIPQATNCPNTNLLKRQQLSCQFGACGTTCLSQGAFCCGPAGTLATSPFWMCDNGACITSVRGTTGIVDCYDPDNPSGTTQSCIDHQPTATCKPTDRCYTCSSDYPFCRWETYIADNEPTLSWFSCVQTQLPDTTFLGATITTDIPSSSRTATAEATNTPDQKGAVLSTGAIIGIAAGGGIAIICIIAILVYCCLKKRSSRRASQQLGTTPAPATQEVTHAPQELDSRQYTRSELDYTGVASSPYSQPSVPIPSPQMYGQNVEHVEHWRQEAAGYHATELPTKNMSYVEPRELHGYGQGGEVYTRDYEGQQDPPVPERESWAYGDDTQHMSPGARQ